MIDPKKIIPLLKNMTVEQEIGHGPIGTVYLVVRGQDGRKLALKHISIPSHEAQTKALIFAGAVSGEAEAQRYYSSLETEIKSEILMLNGIKNAPNLLKIRGYQVDRKLTGVGCDIYILSDYCMSLPTYLQNHYITRLQAVNLAIDLCSALEQLRESGLLHKDVRPSNIFMNGNHRFVLGDLGLIKLDELEYASMPDQMITDYTAPEVVAPDSGLSDSMDIYSVGMILYEIYNGGILPLDEEGLFRRTDAELPAPKFADLALSEIILRACAFDPENRYKNPAEMKEALVLYLQRGNISNDPLDPSVSRTDADTAVDVAAIAAAVTAGQVAEGVDLSAVPTEDEDWTLDDPGDLDAPKQITSLNDLQENDLIIPADGEISVEDFLASVRGTPGLEVVSLDDEGNTSLVPGYETEETLPEDTVYVDSADIHEPAANQLIEETAAEMAEAPVKQPESEETTDDAPAEDAAAQPEEPDYRPRRRPVMLPQSDSTDYDDGYESGEEYLGGDLEEKPSNTWKKVVISVIVLLVLAGGAFSLYTFKTDTVKSMTAEAVTSSSIVVQAELKNSSGVNVVCTNAAGEAATMPYEAGGVTFSNLNPNSDYTFTLESSDGKLLLGGKRAAAKTPQMTNLTGFAATGYSAVSATLSLAGTGSQPPSWTVTLEAEGHEPIVQETTGDEFTIEGLTPATTYTATIARGDGDNLGGTTSCTFTTMDYTRLSSFEIDKLDTDSVALRWEYSGTVPDGWTITGEGDDGSAITKESTGTECVIDGLTSGVIYNMTLSCPSLEATELASISVGVPVVTVLEVTSTANEDGTVTVNWDYTGDTPAQWSVSYVYDSETETDPSISTTETNSIVLEGLIPNTDYTIKLAYADDLGVGGNTTTTCKTATAKQYTKYGCADPTITLAVKGDEANPTNTFSGGQQIAFTIKVGYEETKEQKSAQTMYVVRDSAGKPVFIYESSRQWPGPWTVVEHTGSLPELPQTPGNYTLEIYYDGDFFISVNFNVQ